MTEMTVTEHNEKLVSEKQAILRQLNVERHNMGLLLAAIMRQMKRKTVNIKPENLVPPGVHVHISEDGSMNITFQKPVEQDVQA